MCIICYKPKGVKIPKISTLKNCFESNPNGAGYMYRRNNTVHIRKGFMNFEAFYADMTAHVERKDDAVFHFRIATHGVISPKNTHPFPITSVRSELHELIIDCKRALVHNGILYDFVDRNEDISDSAFFAKMLYPCRRESQYKAIMEHHNRTSKFVVMTSTFTVVSGQFVKKYGCFFSNYGYEDRVDTTFTSVVTPTGIPFAYDKIVGNDMQYNIRDTDLEDEWEKLYGVDSLTSRQYRENKRYASRRGSSSGSDVLTKPTKINLKTTSGNIVSLDTYAEKKDPSEVKKDQKYTLPQTLRVNGKPVVFSEGTSDNEKIEAIKNIFRTPEEKQSFKDYVKNGEKIIIDKLPLVSLESPDGITTYMINDSITKIRFFYLIDKGYRLLIDHKPVGDKDEIVVVRNAKNVTGNTGLTVVEFTGYTAKFFKGGADCNVVVSIRVKEKETKKEKKIREEYTTAFNLNSDFTPKGEKDNAVVSDIQPDFFGDDTGGAC